MSSLQWPFCPRNGWDTTAHRLTTPLTCKQKASVFLVLFFVCSAFSEGAFVFLNFRHQERFTSNDREEPSALLLDADPALMDLLRCKPPVTRTLGQRRPTNGGQA